MSLANINSFPEFTKYLVAQRLFALKPLIVVDVGARGGFESHWAFYGDQVKLIGFEADAEECKKLNRKTPNSRNYFFPVALHQNRGKKTFYITAYPSSSGFYPPDMRHIQRFPDEINLSVVKTLEMETVDFDSFAKENQIDYVDFMKLDTEGSELDILKGATRFLKETILGLSIEVEFSQWHKDQPVFSDVDSFLRSFGFQLFNLTPYRHARKVLPAFSSLLIPGPVEKGQLVWGQALYLRDGVDEIKSLNLLEKGWDNINILKLASLMELFSLSDCAIELIQEAKRGGILRGDVDCFIDRLVPNVNGKTVSYNEYLEKLQIIKSKGCISNLELGRRLFTKFLPRPARQKIRILLIKLRDLIDKILK